MRGALSDLLHSWRGLKRQPGFLAAAWLILALGIGANTTVFSLVNGIHVRPPFGDRSDRLMTLHPTTPQYTDKPGWGHSEISYRDLLDFRAASSVEGVGGFFTRSFVLSGDGSAAQSVRGGSITPDLFPLLGIQPVLGRHFLPEEGAPPGQETSVMLTFRLWQQRYGGDPAIVGKSVIVDERPRTVVGVLPPGFQFPERDSLYAPLRWDDSPRSARNINAVALLRPGVAVDETRAQMNAIARSLEQSYPDTNRGYGVLVVPIRESYVGEGVGATTVVLMTAVGFVLLIVCANLANLMLVRGALRQREVAVRAAMGAGRGRLVWTSLCESIWLAVPGAAIGLLASQWVLDLLLRMLPRELPYWMRFDIDPRVAAFTVGAAVFTAIAVGLLPSIRLATPDLLSDLKEAGRGASSLGPGGRRLQAVLAAAQVALCFGLLVGANLMVRSFLAMQRADLGFDHRPLLSGGTILAGAAYNDPVARSRFFRQAAATLASLPGAEAAAASTSTPGDDGGSAQRLVIDGQTSESEDVRIESIGVTEDLFTVFGLPLLEGRPFTASEVEDPDADVALINRALARRLWPNASALDRRVGFRDGQTITWFRVVGVVPDVHYDEIGHQTDQSRLNVYVPYSRDGARSMAVFVRARVDPATLVAPAREALYKLNPGLPVTRLMTMSELRRVTSWEEEYYGDAMAVFAALALGLACLGIYALVAYAVGYRSREIGVRLALGARPRDVVTMLLWQSAKVGSVGLVAGLLLGALIARGLTRALYGVTTDAWLFVSMAVPLAVAILVATWLPARRAALLDPTVSLRNE